jgi:hypothetical protein
MHVYAFGSVCRGEIDRQSDIDLLALVSSFDARFDPALFSIYSYARMRELWSEGNAFAWHLALESRPLYADDQTDFLADLGKPSPYKTCRADCEKFRALFSDAIIGITESTASHVFELSTIFLAVRNLATCFSLGPCGTPVFGRHAALQLGRWSIPIDKSGYDVLVRARSLSTRGSGDSLTKSDIMIARGVLEPIRGWMDDLVAEVSRQ